ncbi:hypothetical protein EVAR_28706_1 [Eumeta japonica]|uniref:Uncharacterized protein n=1 Tax=Eumeta variegata TaxID=151549 RepID=A0A4C1V455_EUMVA|nr:hypothetical protein EVAR_28706_1 [Eumeta japonica]
MEQTRGPVGRGPCHLRADTRCARACRLPGRALAALCVRCQCIKRSLPLVSDLLSRNRRLSVKLARTQRRDPADVFEKEKLGIILILQEIIFQRKAKY